MKTYYQQEKNSYAIGAAGLATQIASALVMLGLCYVFTPICIGAGDTSLAQACPFERSGAALHEKFSTAANIGKTPIPSVCQQCDDGIAHEPSAFTTTRGDHSFLRTSRPLATSSGSANGLMMVSLSTADRHWCLAEAFNTTLDRKQLDFPARQTPAVVVR